MPLSERHHANPRVHAGPENSLFRVFRTLRGLRQQDLARLTGISQGMITLIERGRTPTPEQKRLITLALGVTVEELFPATAPAAAPVEAKG